MNRGVEICSRGGLSRENRPSGPYRDTGRSPKRSLGHTLPHAQGAPSGCPHHDDHQRRRPFRRAGARLPSRFARRLWPRTPSGVPALRRQVPPIGGDEGGRTPSGRGCRRSGGCHAGPATRRPGHSQQAYQGRRPSSCGPTTWASASCPHMPSTPSTRTARPWSWGTPTPLPCWSIRAHTTFAAVQRSRLDQQLPELPLLHRHGPDLLDAGRVHPPLGLLGPSPPLHGLQGGGSPDPSPWPVWERSAGSAASSFIPSWGRASRPPS